MPKVAQPRYSQMLDKARYGQIQPDMARCNYIWPAAASCDQIQINALLVGIQPFRVQCKKSHSWLEELGVELDVDRHRHQYNFYQRLIQLMKNPPIITRSKRGLPLPSSLCWIWGEESVTSSAMAERRDATGDVLFYYLCWTSSSWHEQ